MSGAYLFLSAVTMFLLLLTVKLFQIPVLLIQPVSFFWLIAAIFTGIGTLMLEYYLNMGIIYFQTGKIQKGVQLDEAWGRSIKISILVPLFLIVCMEEFIFRQLWFQILTERFELGFGAALLITSLFYSLNHIYFGKLAVFSKFISGIVYGLSYLLSGGLIVVPIIVHAVHNFGLLFLHSRGRV